MVFRPILLSGLRHPDLRYAKSAALLREGGALVVVETQHVLAADGDSSFTDVQADYEKIVPDDVKTRSGGPPSPDAVGDLPPSPAQIG